MQDVVTRAAPASPGSPTLPCTREAPPPKPGPARPDALDAELDTSLSSLAWLTQLGAARNPLAPEALPFPEPDTERSTMSTPDDATALDIDWEQEIHRKPPFAYVTLIYMALKESDQERLTLHQIYAWIESNFAFYRHADPGWRNSIRHNLSHAPAFLKVERDPNDEKGKGGYWQLNPDYKGFDHLATKRRRKFQFHYSSKEY